MGWRWLDRLMPFVTSDRVGNLGRGMEKSKVGNFASVERRFRVSIEEAEERSVFPQEVL